MSTEANTMEPATAANIRRARTIGATLVGSQLKKQATSLGESIGEFGDTLSEVALELEQRGRTPWLVPIFDSVATRVSSVATYLRQTENEAFARDFGAFADRQPAAVGAAALIAGFTLARLLRVTLEGPGNTQGHGEFERP